MIPVYVTSQVYILHFMGQYSRCTQIYATDLHMNKRNIYTTEAQKKVDVPLAVVSVLARCRLLPPSDAGDVTRSTKCSGR